MNRSARSLITLLFVIAPILLFAQSTVSVTGVVVDSNDEPLIGASVQVKGQSSGVATDFDGNFTINAAIGSLLKISYVGYTSQEVKVSNSTPLRIVLLEDSQMLDEVVVTAMGINRKESSLTYATQQISGDELMKVQDANFVNSLSGKVAGLSISQSAGGAGGTSKILLRGNKSVMGNNSPLIVVDGIPMTNQVGSASSTYSSSWDPTYSSSSEGGDALSLINPDDIESINVLKGANAAALYGSAAANGVLMITTKKGKEGKVSVTLNSGVTFEKPLLTPALQTVYGSSVDLNANTISVDSWGKKITDLTADELAYPGAKLTNRYHNNVSDFFETGTSWNNSITISGGNEKIRTFFSYANSNSDGILPSNTYNRNTFSFRQSYNLFNNKLKIDVALNYVYAKTTNRGGGGTVMNPLYDLYLTSPNIDMAYYRNNYVNQEGSWSSNSHSYISADGSRVSGVVDLSGPQQIWAYPTASHNNPYWLTKMNGGHTTEERAYGYATANYEIIPGLNVQARLNMDRAKYNGNGQRYATTQNVASMEDYGIYWQDKIFSNDVYVDALATYNKSINDYSISATAGWSGHTVSGETQKIYGNATYYSTDMAKLPTLVNYFEPTISWSGNPVSFSKQSNWDKGLFFTGQVGWKDMVYVEGSYRQDWYRAFRQFSDRGTPDNYGYWSLGGNTLMHKYVKMPEFITYLKLRASYSEVGNSIPNVFYSLGSVNLTTGALTGSGYGYFSNPRPEKSKSTEAGFDISFLNSSIMWDLTYYHTDLTNSYFVAPSASGISTPVNTGLIRNQGIETTLTYNLLRGDWMWKTGVNFAYNDNKIVKTYQNSQGQAARMEQSIANGKILVRYEEGGSYGDMYTLDFRRNDDGTIWLSPNTGTPQLSARNYVKLGNMNSKVQLGWSNTIAWRDLSLYFLINGRIGGKTISLTESYLDNYGMSQRSAEARLTAEREGIVWTAKDGSTVPGMYVGEGSTRTIVPIEEYYKTIGGQKFASEYVYDATNFRMAEISLGYTVRNLFHGFIKSLNVSVVGRNLFFIYKNSPVDPEISLSTKNGLGGVDVFNLPSTRSFGANLKLEF
jgi:TonB-linked SusC/RagA family outer membrane protein